MGLVDVQRNAVQDLTPSLSGWECCLPNPHLTDWATLAWKAKHMYTHMQIHLYIHVYIIYLFLCVYRYVKGNSETLPFPVFPFSFIFFNIFCKIQSRCWEGWLKKDISKEQKTAAVSACTFLGGCHGDLKDQQGEKSGAAAHVLGTGTLGTGRPWAPYSGKEARPSCPPKTFEHGEEQFGIWQATKGTVPRLQT